MTQTISCSHGKVFAACKEPYCYEEADWQKDVRKYVKQGCLISLAKDGEWKFESCDCRKKKKEDVQPTLF